MDIKNNGPLKARLFIGGLKSLFVELVEALDEVEKTGAMRADMIGTLVDVKTAIDLTLKQLQSAQVRCCDHSPECEQGDDEEEEDCDDEEQVSCMNCGVSCDSAYCDFCEDSEDDEEEEETIVAPPPSKKQKAEVVKLKKKQKKVIH